MKSFCLLQIMKFLIIPFQHFYLLNLLLLHYYDEVAPTETYQCDPQTPDIRANIIPLS